jgi:hypothetical protein
MRVMRWRMLMMLRLGVMRLPNRRVVVATHQTRHDDAASSGVQAGRQGVNLLLQLRHAAVRLLLPLARGRRDDAAAAGLAAALAGLALDGVRLAAHLEPAAGLARPRLFRISLARSSSPSSSSSC